MNPEIEPRMKLVLKELRERTERLERLEEALETARWALANNSNFSPSCTCGDCINTRSALADIAAALEGK